jgi:hypothetical protein
MGDAIRPLLGVFSVEDKRLVRPPQSARDYFLILFEPDDPAIRRFVLLMSALVLVALLFFWWLYQYVVSLGTFTPVPGLGWVVRHGWIGALVIYTLFAWVFVRFWTRARARECEFFRIQGRSCQAVELTSAASERSIGAHRDFDLSVSLFYENVGSIRAYAKSVKHRRRIVDKALVLDCQNGHARTCVLLTRFTSEKQRDEFCGYLNRYGIPEVGLMDLSDCDSIRRASGS